MLEERQVSCRRPLSGANTFLRDAVARNDTQIVKKILKNSKPLDDQVR